MITKLGFHKYALSEDIALYKAEKARLSSLQGIRTIPDLTEYMHNYQSALDIPAEPNKKLYRRAFGQNKFSRGPMSTFYAGVTSGIEPGNNIRVKDILQLYKQDRKNSIMGLPAILEQTREHFSENVLKAPLKKEFWVGNKRKLVEKIPKTTLDWIMLANKAIDLYNKIPDIPGI